MPTQDYINLRLQLLLDAGLTVDDPNLSLAQLELLTQNRGLLSYEQSYEKMQNSAAYIARAGGTSPVAAAAHWVNPLDYGAVGDGTTDDSAAFTAALAALPKGGTLVIPAKSFAFASPVTVATPCNILGVAASGANPALGSRIINTQTAGHAFILTGDQVRIRDLAISNSNAAASVTAGAAVYINGGNYCQVEQCRISGHWNGIEANVGYGWDVSKNYIVNQVNYSLYIKDVGNVDAGDPVLMGNTMDCGGSYNTAAHIRYESGGGLKALDNKILHGQYGLDLQIANGAATSILLLNGNSFEGQTTTIWRFGRPSSGTGTFTRINATGNQLTGSACTSDVISIGQNGGITEVKIADNLIYGNNTVWGVRTYTGDNVDVSNNSITSCLVGTAVDAGVTNYRDTNKFTNCGTERIDARAASTTVSGSDIDWTTVQNHFFSSTVTAQNFFRVGVIDRQAITIEVDWEGTIESGITGFAGRATLIGSRNGVSAPVTLTTINNTVSGAVAPTLATDVATTSGTVYIGFLRQAGDGGVGVDLRARVRVFGGVDRILKQ